MKQRENQGKRSSKISGKSTTFLQPPIAQIPSHLPQKSLQTEVVSVLASNPDDAGSRRAVRARDPGTFDILDRSVTRA